MSLGGGLFGFMNKILPGVYHNFFSKERDMTTYADRGYAAIPIEMDWGPEGEVFTVGSDNFQLRSTQVFGYNFAHEKCKPLRDLFLYLKVGHFYRLNKGSKKAVCPMGTAVYGGIRGNDLMISASTMIDEADYFNVKTYLDGNEIDSQIVKSIDEIKDNAYVVFNRSWVISPDIGTKLTGGTNGDVITAQSYQDFLNVIDRKYFNILICTSDDDLIKRLFVAYTKRMRDEVGIKFQTVVQGLSGANYEGVISVYNSVRDVGAQQCDLVYWTGGGEASAAINEGVTNRKYNGEYDIEMTLDQRGLSKYTQLGFFIFHGVDNKVDGEYIQEPRVLLDRNTFTEYEVKKNDDFSDNKIIRIIDQIAIDTAMLFNRFYLGKENNDKTGRISLKAQICNHRRTLQTLRALDNFDPEMVTIGKGTKKGDVWINEEIEPVGVMERLYITTFMA